MVYLTRRLTFSAAHQLGHGAWSDARNRDTFGACANVHGHNYQLWVTVRGVPDAETGFVIDAKRLKEIVHEHVVGELDHRNLSTDVAWLAERQPTTENVAMAIWRRLVPHVEGCALHCVRLQETENISAEYYGELEADTSQ